MGFGERDEDADDLRVVITESEVLNIARARGLVIRDAGVTWEISKGEANAFFPKALIAGGYTEAQLAVVEAAFDGCDVDLFPLTVRRLH